MREPLSPADIAVVSDASIMKDLRIPLRERLVAAMKTRAYAKRDLIYAEGEPATDLYIVLEGWVRVFRTDRSGSEADIGLLGPAQSFGEAAMFLGGRCHGTAQAVEPCRVARMPISALRALLEADANLALAFLGSLSQHLLRVAARLSSDRLHNGKRRLVHFLLERSEGECESLIRIPYDKAVLAGFLGMAPEALSRAFAALRASGVTVDGRDIRIANRRALRRYLG